MASVVLCHSDSTPGCQHWFLLPFTLVLYVIQSRPKAGYSTRGSVLLDFLTEHVSTPNSVLVNPSTLTLPTCTSDAHISLENICAEIIPLFHFTLEVPPPVLCVWLYPLQASCFQTSASLHLLTFLVDLWLCKWFQPLVSVCSLCLLVFFMKIVTSILSNSSAVDTYIKFADDKSRECAKRIIDIHIIFVLVPCILQNESCSILVSTQLALSDSLCC